MTEPVDVLAFARTMNELLVLGALCGGPRHGYQIALDVEERSEGRFVLQHGTLYPVLHRLEHAKLVKSAWEAPPGGRRRRVYSLTAAGTRHLARESARCDEVLQALLVLTTRRSA